MGGGRVGGNGAGRQPVASCIFRVSYCAQNKLVNKRAGQKEMGSESERGNVLVNGNTYTTSGSYIVPSAVVCRASFSDCISVCAMLQPPARPLPPIRSLSLSRSLVNCTLSLSCHDPHPPFTPLFYISGHRNRLRRCRCRHFHQLRRPRIHSQHPATLPFPPPPKNCPPPPEKPTHPPPALAPLPHACISAAAVVVFPVAALADASRALLLCTVSQETMQSVKTKIAIELNYSPEFSVCTIAGYSRIKTV